MLFVNLVDRHTSVKTTHKTFAVYVLQTYFIISIQTDEHSVEEVLERPTGYPKVGGSNHGSGDFSLQPQRNPYLS